MMGESGGLWRTDRRNYKYRYSSMIGDFTSAASSKKWIHVLRWMNVGAFFFGVILTICSICAAVNYDQLLRKWSGGIGLGIVVMITAVAGYIASFRDIFYVSQQKKASTIYIFLGVTSLIYSIIMTIALLSHKPKVLDDRTDRLLETKKGMTVLFVASICCSVYQAAIAAGFIHIQKSEWSMEHFLDAESNPNLVISPFLKRNDEDQQPQNASIRKPHQSDSKLRRIPYDDEDASNDEDDTFFHKLNTIN